MHNIISQIARGRRDDALCMMGKESIIDNTRMVGGKIDAECIGKGGADLVNSIGYSE